VPNPEFESLRKYPPDDVDTYGATMGGKGPLANAKPKPLLKPKPAILPQTASEEKTLRDALAGRK
jgi:hypothetical protein